MGLTHAVHLIMLSSQSDFAIIRIQKLQQLNRFLASMLVDRTIHGDVILLRLQRDSRRDSAENFCTNKIQRASSISEKHSNFVHSTH